MSDLENLTSIVLGSIFRRIFSPHVFSNWDFSEIRKALMGVENSKKIFPTRHFQTPLAELIKLLVTWDKFGTLVQSGQCAAKAPHLFCYFWFQNFPPHLAGTSPIKTLWENVFGTHSKYLCNCQLHLSTQCSLLFRVFTFLGPASWNSWVSVWGKGKCSLENYGIIWKIFPNCGPPPPFGKSIVKKSGNLIELFRVFFLL